METTIFLNTRMSNCRWRLETPLDVARLFSWGLNLGFWSRDHQTFFILWMSWISWYWASFQFMVLPLRFLISIASISIFYICLPPCLRRPRHPILWHGSCLLHGLWSQIYVCSLSCPSSRLWERSCYRLSPPQTLYHVGLYTFFHSRTKFSTRRTKFSTRTLIGIFTRCS